MLQGEHSAILSTFIKLPFSITTLVLSIFNWSLKTCFTVLFEEVIGIFLKFYKFICEDKTKNKVQENLKKMFLFIRIV